MSEHTDENDQIVCPCGHIIDLHNAWGCTAYVRPRIGGSGACCTRTPTQVARAAATTTPPGATS